MRFDIQRFVAQEKQSVHSGSTILLKVGKYIIGRAQSLEGRRSFGTEGVYEIGSIMPQEHVVNRYEGSVTLERFLIRHTDLAKAGMAALGEEILKHGIIDIEVIDKYVGVRKGDNGEGKHEDSVIRVYRGCTCSDYTESFRVGAIAGENATFLYLNCDRGNNGSEEIASIYGGLGSAYYATTAQQKEAKTKNVFKNDRGRVKGVLTYLDDFAWVQGGSSPYAPSGGGSSGG